MGPQHFLSGRRPNRWLVGLCVASILTGQFLHLTGVASSWPCVALLSPTGDRMLFYKCLWQCSGRAFTNLHLHSGLQTWPSPGLPLAFGL